MSEDVVTRVEFDAVKRLAVALAEHVIADRGMRFKLRQGSVATEVAAYGNLCKALGAVEALGSQARGADEGGMTPEAQEVSSGRPAPAPVPPAAQYVRRADEPMPVQGRDYTVTTSPGEGTLTVGPSAPFPEREAFKDKVRRYRGNDVDPIRAFDAVMAAYDKLVAQRDEARRLAEHHRNARYVRAPEHETREAFVARHSLPWESEEKGADQ